MEQIFSEAEPLTHQSNGVVAIAPEGLPDALAHEELGRSPSVSEALDSIGSSIGSFHRSHQGAREEVARFVGRSYRGDSLRPSESVMVSAEVRRMIVAFFQPVTEVGQGVLASTSCHLTTSVVDIVRRQDAVRELHSNPELGEAVRGILTSFAEAEYDLNFLLREIAEAEGCKNDKERKKVLGGCRLDHYHHFREKYTAIRDAICALPEVHSAVLVELKEELENLAAHPLLSLPEETLFFSKGKIVDASNSRRGALGATPIRRVEYPLEGMTSDDAGGVFMGGAFLSGLVALLSHSSNVFMGGVALSAVTAIGAFTIGSISSHRAETIRRGIKEFLVSHVPDIAAFQRPMAAIGILDELMSFAGLMDRFGSQVSLPTVVDAPQHIFKARDLRNPLLCSMKPHVVGNDVVLEHGRPFFITGPNSGGKTTFAKGVLQNQVLAQMGAPVFAQDAVIAIADNLGYQIPRMDSLHDEHGRFGSELKATRDLLFGSTPKSLIIMDELAQGTTHAESTEIGGYIMRGFKELGCSTVLITHDLKLAEEFEVSGEAVCYQVVLDGSTPTYKLAPGVATTALANEIARQIGFCPEDIAAFLKRKREG